MSGGRIDKNVEKLLRKVEDTSLDPKERINVSLKLLSRFGADKLKQLGFADEVIVRLLALQKDRKLKQKLQDTTQSKPSKPPAGDHEQQTEERLGQQKKCEVKGEVSEAFGSTDNKSKKRGGKKNSDRAGKKNSSIASSGSLLDRLGVTRKQALELISDRRESGMSVKDLSTKFRLPIRKVTSILSERAKVISEIQQSFNTSSSNQQQQSPSMASSDFGIPIEDDRLLLLQNSTLEDRNQQQMGFLHSSSTLSMSTTDQKRIGAAKGRKVKSFKIDNDDDESSFIGHTFGQNSSAKMNDDFGRMKNDDEPDAFDQDPFVFSSAAAGAGRDHQEFSGNQSGAGSHLDFEMMTDDNSYHPTIFSSRSRSQGMNNNNNNTSCLSSIRPESSLSAIADESTFEGGDLLQNTMQFDDPVDMTAAFHRQTTVVPNGDNTNFQMSPAAEDDVGFAEFNPVHKTTIDDQPIVRKEELKADLNAADSFQDIKTVLIKMLPVLRKNSMAVKMNFSSTMTKNTGSQAQLDSKYLNSEKVIVPPKSIVTSKLSKKPPFSSSDVSSSTTTTLNKHPNLRSRPRPSLIVPNVTWKEMKIDDAEVPPILFKSEVTGKMVDLLRVTLNNPSPTPIYLAKQLITLIFSRETLMKRTLDGEDQKEKLNGIIEAVMQRFGCDNLEESESLQKRIRNLVG